MTFNETENLHLGNQKTLDSAENRCSCSLNSSRLETALRDSHSSPEWSECRICIPSDRAVEGDHIEGSAEQRRHFQQLYQMKYKSYIQTILETNENHAALSQLKSPAAHNRQWLQQQVLMAEALLKRLLLDKDSTKRQGLPETLHCYCYSSPIETARKQLHNTSSPFTSTPVSQFSHRRSAQRQRQWRKRVATSSGKKGTDLKKINLIHSPVDSFSYHASPNLLPDTQLQHTQSSNSTFTEQIIFDHDDLYSNQMDSQPDPLHHNHSFSTSSLSPITQRQSWNPTHSSVQFQQLDHSFDDKSHPHVNDTLQSPDCTILPRKVRLQTRNNIRVKTNLQLQQNLHQHQEEDETPSNVQLQKGTFFQLNPLSIRQQQNQQRNRLRPLSNNTLASREIHHRQELIIDDQTFFAQYGPRVMSSLRIVSSWLLSKDTASPKPRDANRIIHHTTPHRAALVLNLTQKQAVSMTLCMFAKNGTQNIRPSLPTTPMLPLSNNSNIPGGTLLILRNKEELLLWERAFREQSCYSVWNHAAVQAKTRRRVADTASKCAGVHIVLTTIDCIKSKEVPILVDAKGRAVDPHRSKRQQGTIRSRHCPSQPWYSSRNIREPNKTCTGTRNHHMDDDDDDDDIEDSQSEDSYSDSHSSSTNNRPAVVKVLSVLHGIRWHRLIFVDILEKSYLTQQGGIRSEAAITLHGSSRFVLLHFDL